MNKSIDEIAAELSEELVDVYNSALTKALNGSTDELFGEEQKPTRLPSEASPQEQIRAVSRELRLHSERFTVELIKRITASGYRL